MNAPHNAIPQAGLVYGKSLRKSRITAGFSLRELARKAGISASFLSDIELGRRYPSRKTHRKLREKLGRHAEMVYAIRSCPTCGRKMNI